MRIIEVCDTPIRTVAVSPDGRFVAAASKNGPFAVFHWATGNVVLHRAAGSVCTQIAFAPDTSWVAPGFPDEPLELESLESAQTVRLMTSTQAGGGVAVSPDGKRFVAVQFTGASRARLAVWELPSLRPRPQSEFDDWPPFRRIACSRNGEYIAGIWEHGFELRYAGTGGIDHRFRPFKPRPFSSVGFVSFTHDSTTCVFGWDSEIHVLDLSTGTSKVVWVTTPETRGNPPLNATEHQKDAMTEYHTPYCDASFTGSGRYFATIEQPDRWARWVTDRRAWSFASETDPTCFLRFRDVKTREVVREYDWQCGPLTCLTFTADSTAGVCGTSDGRLVQFDVDE